MGGVIGWIIIRPVNWLLERFFRGFNWCFEQATRVYGGIVRLSLRLSIVVLIVYGGLLCLTYHSFTMVPSGFIPSQDKGYLIVNIQLPDSSSQERTVEIMDRIQKIIAETPGTAHVVDIPGQSFVMNGISSNFGSTFIILKPFSERRDPKLNSEAIAMTLRRRFAAEIKGAQILVFGPAAVDGLGFAGGFKIMLESTGNTDLKILEQETTRFLHAREQDARVHRHVQQFPCIDAATLCGCGPGQMQDHEGRPQQRL